MKTPALILSLTVAAGLAPVVRAQSERLVPPSAPVESVSEKASAVGLLPHQKQGKPLDSKERNPFAELVKTASTGEVTDENSEESRIRSVLSGFRISGVSRGGDGRLKAQLGGYVLDEGRDMPPLIANQTDKLKVTKVTETKVEITWVDVEGTKQPRKFVVGVDIEPTVRTKLPGAGAEGDDPGLSPVDPRADEKRLEKALTSHRDAPSPAE